MGYEKRGEKNNKEVMIKHDQDQRKTRHCLMDIKHKDYTVQSNSDWNIVRVMGCADSRLC